MKEALSKIKYIFPAEKMQSNIAIFFSIFALFFAVGSSNVPCLNADTCSVGSEEVFSGTVTIQNNTNYGVKLTGNPTANRTITFPDADGTVKLAGATLTADKILVSDTNGEVAVTDKYPFTLGTAGQFLKVASSGLTMDFLTVGGLDSLTADAPYLSVNSSGAIDSSGSLTASTPLKSNAQGQITASDLDPTTDFAVGSGTSGQQLRINSSASAWEVFTPSGGAGSFNAVASQNLVAGTVGLESNGQVRNIDVLQNGVSQLNISQSIGNSSTPNMELLTSYYNSNINGQIVLYRDYDSNNQSSCDTHFYVDVVKENSGTLSNWGRQCVSNEWAQHQTNGYTQYSSTNNTQPHQYSFDRYGLEHDDSVNNYVFVYIGGAGNNSNAGDGQIWSVPIQINPSNNTLIVGTETLLHDQHVCNNSNSCNNTNQMYYPQSIDSNVYAQQTSDANRMWIFYKAYRGGYYSNAYVWFKSYQCNFTNSTSDSCTPYGAPAKELATSSGTTHLKDNWYDALNPVVWWDNTSQAFLILNRSMQSSQCRIQQHRLAENYNSGWNSHGGTVIYLNHGSTGLTDDISGGTFNTSGSSTSCGQSQQRPIHVPQHNSFMFVFSSGSTNDVDNYFFQLKGDINSYTGTPVEIAKGSIQNLITDETCANALNQYCTSNLYNLNGHVFIDTSVTPYKYYWHNRSMVDRNICTLDGVQSKCAEIYEWSFDSVTGVLDNTTFKHYDYQDRDESYWNDSRKGFGIWKDSNSGTVYTLNLHSNLASNPANNGLLHAVAFVIPDNISEYIGYVTQSANSGATVTVYSIGAVIDGLTGLTIGAEYYVKDDGSLGTAGTYKIGRAIATDKIYITDTR